MHISKLIEAATQAANKPILLENQGNLEQAAEQWRQADILGIDTEFLRERTYRADLGLVQVSDGEQAWLVDVVKIQDLNALRQMLVDPNILKVFHSSSEDFEVLWHTLQVSPAPVVDTQIACAMIGQSLQMSYHNAIKWLTGIEVDKDQTRSNWLRRPLSDRQLHYAATDVVFLPQLCAEVRDKLVEQNKWQWLEEDVAMLTTQSRETLEPQSAYLRLGGAYNLNQQQLKVLRELAAWRESLAITRNLARGFVIKDQDLLKIARKMPDSLEALTSIEDLHEKLVHKHAASLLQCVQSGLKSNQDVSLPDPLTGAQKRTLSEMRKIVLAEAEAYDVDPALLASKKVLESLLRSFESGEAVPERLSGWRYNVITSKLLDAIQSTE